MTLLDAPVFNEARENRRRLIVTICLSIFVVLVVGFWISAGFPVDWPWNWYTHLRGRAAINAFFKDLEKNDMADAYAVWLHDPHWQQDKAKTEAYPFNRFQEDWSPTSSQNEYGPIKSHEIAAARIVGNVLVAGVRVNGMKSKAVFLNYDPKTKELGFSPIELYLGP